MPKLWVWGLRGGGGRLSDVATRLKINMAPTSFDKIVASHSQSLG